MSSPRVLDRRGSEDRPESGDVDDDASGAASLALRGPESNRFRSTLLLNQGELRLAKTSGNGFSGDPGRGPRSRAVLELKPDPDFVSLSLNKKSVIDFGPTGRT
jgi:hypothetical protein